MYILYIHTHTHTHTGCLTIAVEGSSLVLKLNLVKVGRLHKAREGVLLCQLLAGLEGIGRPYLHTRRNSVCV